MSVEFSREIELAQAVLATQEAEAEAISLPGVVGLRIGPYNAALLRRRTELGLTQKQLGQAIGWSVSLIAHIETLRHFPSSDQAEKIATVLKTSPDQLFPAWLKEFTRGKDQPAQVRVEIPEAELRKPLLTSGQRVDRQPEQEVDPDEEAGKEDLKRVVKDLLDYLNPRQRKVLELRFGVGVIDGKTRTFEEVGAKLRVTGERVRQIEGKALSNLRHYSLSRKLRDFYPQEHEDSERNLRALLNGAVNAIHEGDAERALRNLTRVETAIENRVIWSRKYTTDTMHVFRNQARYSNFPSGKDKDVDDLREVYWLMHQANALLGKK